MKRKLSVKILLSLTAICLTLFTAFLFVQPKREAGATVIDHKGVIKVYLIAGQSNAVGYGQDTGGVLAADSRYINGFDNVLYYDNNERYGTDLGNAFQPVRLGMGKDANSSGAEIGMAYALADNGEMNAVIKCAWGATHLYPDKYYSVSLQQGTWTSPTYIKNHNIDTTTNPKIGAMYARFMQTVKTGLAALVQQGYEPVIQGLWWMQGEAEMGSLEMASAYTELLTTLIADMRADLSKISGADLSEMPFVFGLPSWNTAHAGGPAFEEKVRSDMKAIADNKDIINVDCVDCRGLTQHDGWHFNAMGQHYLGEQFIQKLACLDEGSTVNLNEYVSMTNDVEIRDNEPIGLRFGAKISNYNPQNGYKYGMIIIPTDYISEYQLNGDYIAKLEENGVEFLNLRCNVLNGDFNGDGIIENYIQGSIVDLKYKNLNRGFTAIAYIKSGEDYLYSSSTVSESVAHVASRELLQKGAQSEIYSELVKYTNGAANYLLGIDESLGYENSSFDIEVPEELRVDYSDSQIIKQLTVKQSPEMNYYVEFSSDNEDIATVDEKGNVCGISAGETVIRVKCLEIEKQIKVTVAYPEIDGITVDGILDECYTRKTENVLLNDGRYYSVNAIKTQSGVFIYTEGMFNSSVSAGDSEPWYVSTNFEFKLNKGMQSYVNVKGQGAGVSNFVYKVQKQENGKYLHKAEIFVAKELISNWGESVQLNYAWKTPNENAYMQSDMIAHSYTDWNTDWHSYQRLGGLSEFVAPLKANLFITENGLASIQVPNEGVILDGVIDENEYASKALTRSNSNLSVTVHGKIINKDAYLAFEIVHGKWSAYDCSPGSWWKNDNIEIYLNDLNLTLMFFDGKLILPANVDCGIASTTENSEGKLVTVVELYVRGNSEQYKLKIGMNGAAFAWVDVCWSQAFGYLTADGVYRKEAMKVGNALLDGVLDDAIWTETVLSNSITTNANGATLTIMGTKDEKGIYLAATVLHQVGPSFSLDNSNNWHTFMNVEFRLNGSDAQIMATTRNESAAAQTYAYCKTEAVAGGGYFTTFEIFVPYSTVGATFEQAQISLRANGWFESGWTWLFGGQNWNATHYLTAEGVFAK